MAFTLNSIAEVFGVLTGGVRRQPSYQGQTEITVDADLQKLIGWTGASTHITVFEIRDSDSATPSCWRAQHRQVLNIISVGFNSSCR